MEDLDCYVVGRLKHAYRLIDKNRQVWIKANNEGVNSLKIFVNHTAVEQYQKSSSIHWGALRRTLGSIDCVTETARKGKASLLVKLKAALKKQLEAFGAMCDARDAVKDALRKTEAFCQRTLPSPRANQRKAAGTTAVADYCWETPISKLAALCDELLSMYEPELLVRVRTRPVIPESFVPTWPPIRSTVFYI
eukprot:Rmarinus@m.2565